MKFTALIASLAIAALPTSLAATLAYDTHYDDPNGSMTTVACSDGANGLITRGFPTFGSLPHFPHIGAVDAIKSWNSTSCGSCWQVTYTNSTGGKKTLNILGIDVAGSGFNVALSAMNELTNGNAIQFGRVNVDAVRVASSVCGL